MFTYTNEYRTEVTIPFRHVLVIMQFSRDFVVRMDGNDTELSLSLSEYNDFMAGFKEWEARH